MKDVISNRIKRIEELLRKENVICHVAMRKGLDNPINWNGKEFHDEDELGIEHIKVCGKNCPTPVVILTMHIPSDEEKKVLENTSESLTDDMTTIRH